MKKYGDFFKGKEKETGFAGAFVMMGLGSLATLSGFKKAADQPASHHSAILKGVGMAAIVAGLGVGLLVGRAYSETTPEVMLPEANDLEEKAEEISEEKVEPAVVAEQDQAEADTGITEPEQEAVEPEKSDLAVAYYTYQAS